jgi:hypothetical protein
MMPETSTAARLSAEFGAGMVGRLLAGLAGLALGAACGKEPESAEGRSLRPETGPLVVSVHRGLPASLGREVAEHGRPLAFIVGPGRLDLITWGSSSCPQLPVRAERAPEGALRLVLDDAVGPDGICSADDAATTAGIRVDEDLTSQPVLMVVVAFPQERSDEQIVARRGVS